jgi:hypothetical protein
LLWFTGLKGCVQWDLCAIPTLELVTREKLVLPCVRGRG